jgi:hypothetical protein
LQTALPSYSLVEAANQFATSAITRPYGIPKIVVSFFLFFFSFALLRCCACLVVWLFGCLVVCSKHFRAFCCFESPAFEHLSTDLQVFISDGGFDDSESVATINQAAALKDQGVSIISVGAGVKNRNDLDKLISISSSGEVHVSTPTYLS